MQRVLTFALGAVLLGGGAASASPAPALKLERVVLLMRHGVRPPTKAPAMPVGIAAEAWPDWEAAPGYLTARGAAAVRLLGLADRAFYARQGLVARSGCPAGIRVRSDSDQRTIATGDAYLAGFAPDCAIANQHRAQGVDDPLFLNAGENGVPFDPARADAAVAHALGPAGISGAEVRNRALLARLDRILCGTASGRCGVGGEPSRVVAASPAKRPKLEGALDRASTAAQILLLEYADGKPMAQVGWGRATAADITALSAFHALEFQILARPLYVASVNAAPLAQEIVTALRDRSPRAPRLLALIGHDTNVASLGGLLDLHWQAPGFAADDPPPGGAILIELLRDARGRRFVRLSFRAQTLDQLRTLASSAPYRQRLVPGGCAPICPLDRLVSLLLPRSKAVPPVQPWRSSRVAWRRRPAPR